MVAVFLHQPCIDLAVILRERALRRHAIASEVRGAQWRAPGAGPKS
jgi:hypothetical protein